MCQVCDRGLEDRRCIVCREPIAFIRIANPGSPVHVAWHFAGALCLRAGTRCRHGIPSGGVSGPLRRGCLLQLQEVFIAQDPTKRLARAPSSSPDQSIPEDMQRVVDRIFQDQHACWRTVRNPNEIVMLPNTTQRSQGSYDAMLVAATRDQISMWCGSPPHGKILNLRGGDPHRMKVCSGPWPLLRRAIGPFPSGGGQRCACSNDGMSTRRARAVRHDGLTTTLVVHGRASHLETLTTEQLERMLGEVWQTLEQSPRPACPRVGPRDHG